MKIVLIGHGMVGHKFLESLLAQHPTQCQITVLAEEPRPAYDRVHLTSYLSGKTAKELSLCRMDFAEAHGIDLRLNTQVAAIDRQAKIVTTQQGEQFAYDKLIMATGSYAFVPPIEGHDRKNCFVYRTLEDLDAILEASRRAKVGTEIGRAHV